MGSPLVVGQGSRLFADDDPRRERLYLADLHAQETQENGIALRRPVLGDGIISSE